jgi:membrane protein implicated in regulation of membrane protease activity
LSGVAGAGIVYALFSFLRRAEAPDAFSLGDLVGRQGRVTVGIPAGRNGSVIVSHGGASDELTATSDIDIAAGTTVTIIDVVASTLIVAPVKRANEGDTNA